MYVCVCNAVTEREVYKAINAGATTVKALSNQLGVGTQCGSCVGFAKQCLSKARQQGTNLPSNIVSINKQDAA